MASAQSKRRGMTRVATAEDDEEMDDRASKDEDGDCAFDDGFGRQRMSSDDESHTVSAIESGALPESAHNKDRPASIKAFVALGNHVHSITLPLLSVDSWSTLSQRIHETCEEEGLSNVPEHGIMHLVLNVNGETVPVTGSTQLEVLWSAKAIKVSITHDSNGSIAKSPRRTRRFR